MLNNPHKLETERVAAKEYREKFYPASTGGYLGAGAGATSSETPAVGSGSTKTYEPYTQTSM